LKVRTTKTIAMMATTRAISMVGSISVVTQAA
jgi:hypothetical protein